MCACFGAEFNTRYIYEFIQKSHFDNSEHGFGMSMQADEVNPFFRSDVSPANQQSENYDMERLLRSRGDVPSLPEDQKKLVIEDHNRQCPDLGMYQGSRDTTVQLEFARFFTLINLFRLRGEWKNQM